MLSNGSGRRRWLAAAAGLLLLPSAAWSAAAPKKAQGRAEFRKAEQLRAQLEARPEVSRKPSDYLAVIRHYERVVHLAPTLSVADDSLAWAARLYADMGHQFRQRQDLARAVEKCRFLLKEYPGSKFAAEARQTLAGLEKELAPAAEVRPSSAEALRTVSQSSGSEKIAHVTHIRHWSTPTYTRVVIELDGPIEYQAGRIANPDRIFFDLHGARLSPALRGQAIEGDNVLLKRIRMAQNQVGIVRIVLEVGQVRDYSAFILPNPFRVVVDINGGQPRQPVATAAARPPAAVAERPAPAEAESSSELLPEVAANAAPSSKPVFERVLEPAPAAKEKEGRGSKAPARDSAARGTAAPPASGKEKEGEAAQALPGPPPHIAKPASSGRRSLIRALGLKIGKIVIDAGHGGHDTGTIGPTGLMEKDLVLDVAKRLGALLEDRLGGEAAYTRKDDSFIPLEARTALANEQQADLFVSIHANSSRDPGARGVETYYLNFTTAQDALEVAARENAVSEKSIHELQDLVKKITLKEKLEESREFAAEVQRALVAGMSRGHVGLRNRGVKKAPFVVLIGANMPSILAEISFISNPTDERLLRKPEYRQRVAEALYRGIQHYANSLSGVKVAHSRLGE